jgi:hypothetical protein
VITNNLSAVLELSEEGIEIILLGGTYQPRSQSVAGRFAIENWAIFTPTRPSSASMGSLKTRLHVLYRRSRGHSPDDEPHQWPDQRPGRFQQVGRGI